MACTALALLPQGISTINYTVPSWQEKTREGNNSQPNQQEHAVVSGRTPMGQ
jgi:hypothetical protein